MSSLRAKFVRNPRPRKIAGILSTRSLFNCALAMRTNAGATAATTPPPARTFYAATCGNDSDSVALSQPFATAPPWLAQGAGNRCHVRSGSYDQPRYRIATAASNSLM
jgi:hypothetical protein